MRLLSWSSGRTEAIGMRHDTQTGGQVDHRSMDGQCGPWMDQWMDGCKDEPDDRMGDGCILNREQLHRYTVTPHFPTDIPRRSLTLMSTLPKKPRMTPAIGSTTGCSCSSASAMLASIHSAQFMAMAQWQLHSGSTRGVGDERLPLKQQMAATSSFSSLKVERIID